MIFLIGKTIDYNIKTLYTYFKENKLIVNRSYQRNLVWDKGDKQNFIDTVFKQYPIPSLILSSATEDETFEVIDGIQRLNALFEYIENEFSVDINESAVFFKKRNFGINEKNARNLTAKEVEEFLCSTVPVTVYNAENKNDINEIFLRINSFGKILTPQEIRQAAKRSEFLEVVKKLGRILREDILATEIEKVDNKLKFLDEIKRNKLGFKLKIEDTFWCRHGIYTANDLKRSQDEELIADIILSIVVGKPYPVGKDQLDDYYGVGKLNRSLEIDKALQNYGIEQIVSEIVDVFINIVYMCKLELEDKSITLSKVLFDAEKPRKIVESFYTLFVAMHELIFKKGMEPINYSEIFIALRNLSQKLSCDIEDRSRCREINVNLCKGLIESYFKETANTDITLNIAEFEHLIKMSSVERPEYDFKQGLFLLNRNKRELDKKMFETIFCTIASLANLGKGKKGYLFIGITDKERDTLVIEELDHIKVPRISGFGIVGLEREAMLKNVSLDSYISMITQRIRQSDLPDWLKTQVNTSIMPISYKGYTILKISVNSGDMPVWYNDKLYIRDGLGNFNGAEGSYVESVYRLFK